MAKKDAMRRGLVAVTGGAVLLGTGAAVGGLTAELHRDWLAGAGAAAAGTQAAQAAVPIEVTDVVEEHVTPDPVVVRRQTVRVRTVEQDDDNSSAAAAPRTSTTRPAASSTRTQVAPKPAKVTTPRARTVVHPAPAAPRPAPKPAPHAPVTKSS